MRECYIYITEKIYPTKSTFLNIPPLFNIAPELYMLQLSICVGCKTKLEHF